MLGLEMGLARDADSSSHEIYKKRNNPAAAGPLWFGPRLGRRKRSLDDDDDKFEDRVNELDDEEGEEGIRDLLRSSPWAIIPLRNKGK